jgi:hypothetical protein
MLVRSLREIAKQLRLFFQHSCAFGHA